MSDFTLVVNQEDIFSLSATDSSTPPNLKPAAFSAKVSDYAVAYIAAAPAGGGNLHVVGKTPGDVTVTISGHSQDGTPLPSVTLTYTFTPVPVPQATQFATGAHTTRNQDILTPADPGTDTITGAI